MQLINKNAQNLSASIKGESLLDKAKQKLIAMICLITAFVITSPAMAGLNGGFNTAQSDTSSFQKWLYTVVGICAMAYLSWVGLKIKAGKATWSDLGVGFIQVAAAGGAVTAGTYFYSMFAS
jgi:hypothetical protein